MSDVIEMSVREFQRLCKRQIEYLELASQYQNFQILRMKAQIHLKKAKKYSDRVYGIVLSDGHILIKAQSEYQLMKEIQDQDLVEVLCFCQPYKEFDQIVMQANIIAIHSIHAAAHPTILNQTNHLFKKIKNRPNRFPRPQQEIMLSLIYSSSSAALVNQDFYHALGMLKDRIHIEELPCRLSYIAELQQCIVNAKGNVLVMIRGGGDANQLINFDDEAILQALANSSAYRILGIGHSADHNLANAFADFAATTPTAAGEHLKQQLLWNIREQQNVMALEKENTHLKSTYQHSQQEIQALQQKIIEQNAVTQTQLAHMAAKQRSTLLVTVVLAALLLLLVFGILKFYF